MMNNNQDKIFAFFGSDDFSVIILDELKKAGHIPSLIVAPPDRKQGRGMTLTPPQTKVWAKENNIEVFQPEQLNEEAQVFLQEKKWGFFVVASYGLIVPRAVLEIPKYGALNVHPSLLPKHRGATPIETAILQDEKETGVTIMLMDHKMDHGPIISQEVVVYDLWPTKIEVRNDLAKKGGALLSEIIELYLSEEIIPQEQDHKTATFTKKITKADGEISISNPSYETYLRYIALSPWPGLYFFDDDKKRVKITDAAWENNTFVIKKVIPEGKKETVVTEEIKAKYKIS